MKRRLSLCFNETEDFACLPSLLAAVVPVDEFPGFVPVLERDYKVGQVTPVGPGGHGNSLHPGFQQGGHVFADVPPE